MPVWLAPRLFVSYARRDHELIAALTAALQQRGFRVFLDTGDIDPGDNFVARLSKEIERATGIVAVISEDYSRSRWGQAELYYALARGKTVVPLVVPPGQIADLDEPLQRLLRDTHYVSVAGGLGDKAFQTHFATLLGIARRRHRRALMTRVVSFGLVGLLLAGGGWWAVANLNQFEQAGRRADVLADIAGATAVLQRERVAALASQVAGDQQAIGTLLHLAQDPARPDVARVNALTLASELRQGQKASRWYVRKLDVERATLRDIAFANTSFLGGSWGKVTVEHCTFSGVFWSAEPRFTMAGVQFRDVQVFGGEMEGITAVDVAFVNSKFRGTIIDTTGFSKVRFSSEEPRVEGTPLITPHYALFERSLLISRRTPPAKGVLDLTQTGDDVVFDRVHFVECRLEGWFRPEWFRGSSFDRCEFPASLSKESLERAGNVVHYY